MFFFSLCPTPGSSLLTSLSTIRLYNFPHGSQEFHQSFLPLAFCHIQCKPRQTDANAFHQEVTIYKECQIFTLSILVPHRFSQNGS
jgi:hypothetical protein